MYKRQDPREKKNDPQLGADFAALADVYVDDAFGSAHRPDASVDGAAYAMRAKGGPVVAGFLMGAEIGALGIAVGNPPRPYVAIMGGAKISDKIKLIENLLDKDVYKRQGRRPCRWGRRCGRCWAGCSTGRGRRS